MLLWTNNLWNCGAGPVTKMADEESPNVNEEPNPKPKHKGKHDKPKPWDDPSIDHWKVEKFDPSWNESGMVVVSSFSTLFPQYRGLVPKIYSLSKRN